jgi:hypothetical protein
MAKHTVKVQVGNGVARTINRAHQVHEQLESLKEEMARLREELIVEAGKHAVNLRENTLQLINAKGVSVDISQDADSPVVWTAAFIHKAREMNKSEPMINAALRVSIPDARKLLGEDVLNGIASEMKPGSIKVKF